MKIIKASIIVCLVAAGIFLILEKIAQPQFVSNTTSTPSIDQTKPRVLVVCLTSGFGGEEAHTIELYKQLIKNGYYTSILVPIGSKLEDRLRSLGFSYHQTRVTLFEKVRPMYHYLLQRCLKKLCSENAFNIIHCNNRQEVPDAVAIKKNQPLNVIFTRHVPDTFDTHKLKGCDYVVTVSQNSIEYFEQENRMRNLGLKGILHLPPLFDATNFLTYLPRETHHDYFKNTYGIEIGSGPVIAVIANFYTELSHKNHPLLLEAIKKLVEKNKPVHVMLAGDGPRRGYLQKLVNSLNLNNYVHFLGFTNDTPALLYHSDMLVLPSSKEAFGLVYCEAGLMKKPSIGATKTGAQSIIVHEKTGLIFENSNAHDLVQQIERLIDRPHWARELGLNAYDHIKKNFMPDILFTQYESLYKAP